MKKKELQEELLKIGLPTAGIRTELESRLRNYVRTLEKKLNSKKRKFEQDSLSKDEIILENLECPVCSDYITPPIYQCDSGHLLCNRCRMRTIEQARNCPVCRSYLGEVRNLALEKIVSKLSLKCPHATRGCDEILKYVKVKEHLQYCDYRDIICTDPNCQWIGTFSTLKEHYLKCIKSKQGYHLIYSGQFKNSEDGEKALFRDAFPKVCGKSTKLVPNALFIRLYDTGIADFILQLEVIGENSMIVSCFFVGTEANRKGYSWSILFKGAKRFSSFKLEMSATPMPVCCYQWNSEECHKRSLTCMLPIRSIHECINKRGDLPFTVEFKKLN